MDSIDFLSLEKAAKFLKASDTHRTLLLAGALGLPYERGTEKRIHVIGATLRGKQHKDVVLQADWKDAVRQQGPGWNAALKCCLAADNPAHCSNRALCIAVEHGYIDLVRLLLQDPRVDPSQDNQRILRKAIEFEHVDVAKLLLKDPRVDIDVAIAEAERMEWVRIVTDLKKLQE